MVDNKAGNINKGYVDHAPVDIKFTLPDDYDASKHTVMRQYRLQKDDGTKVIPSTPVTADSTLYAHWTKNDGQIIPDTPPVDPGKPEETVPDKPEDIKPDKPTDVEPIDPSDNDDDNDDPGTDTPKDTPDEDEPDDTTEDTPKKETGKPKPDKPKPEKAKTKKKSIPKTFDSTPILPFAVGLGMIIAGIVLLVSVFTRKRKS